MADRRERPFEADDRDRVFDSCGYGPVATGRFGADERDLCEFCASTMIGIWTEHPGVHDATKRELGKAIAWCANRLREILEGE